MNVIHFILAACLALATNAYGKNTNKVNAAAKTIAIFQPRIDQKLELSLSNEANAALDRGLNWLIKKQKKDGSWSNSDYPALTGLALWAIVLSDHPGKKKAIARAVPYILSCVQSNGSIHRPKTNKIGTSYANYNTSLCMIALQAVRDPKLAPVILNARKFLADSQHLEKDIYYGGMGYDATVIRNYADLNNSIFAFEAMRLTQSTEAFRKKGQPKVDLNWKAAEKFVSSCQNKGKAGPNNAGGWFYRPDDSKVGVITNAVTGEKTYLSHGSMTYAGLLSLRYAKVPVDDPRVKAGIGWAARHWTLDINTGADKEALYSYYHLMARTLVVYGRDNIFIGDKIAINGRVELVKKLVSLQKIDPDTGAGYWVNENGRYMEADPVLTTSYALVAIEILLNPKVR